VKTADVIAEATTHLQGLVGHRFDVLEVAKPVSPEAAVNLAKIVSKLSPIVGNLIEFNAIEYLNDVPVFAGHGEWRRQDPGFPDNIFSGTVQPTPGLEIKAWFPLATEITARFKGSQNQLVAGNTHVAMLAWLPEFLIFGKPVIVAAMVVCGLAVAKARDEHYHDLPNYLVLEPEDTTTRAANLQQTNTAGYRFQGTLKELAEAAQLVATWGAGGRAYSAERVYQDRVRELASRYHYRLDTNFAKLDRVDQKDIEAFKANVYALTFHGRTIGDWNRLLLSRNVQAIKIALRDTFGIADADGTALVE
jgi:hypothetical protein